MWSREKMVTGTGDGNTHVIVGIVVLGGWSFPLFCKASGEIIEGHFGFMS